MNIVSARLSFVSILLLGLPLAGCDNGIVSVPGVDHASEANAEKTPATGTRIAGGAVGNPTSSVSAADFGSQGHQTNAGMSMMRQ
jgi:hypothetical protein